MPFIHRYFEQKGYLLLAEFTSLAAYSWMVFSFLFLVNGLILDLIHILYKLNCRTKFIVPVIINCLIFIYGYFEAADIRPQFVTIKSSLILPQSRKVTLVQISDIHLDLTFPKARINKIIEIIKQAEPDILVATGDFIDGVVRDEDDIALRFRQIRTTYGKYAVTGNHEYYYGLKKSVEFIEKAGFKMLSGETLLLSHNLLIAGVADKNSKEALLLQELSTKRFNILLKHRPVVLPAAFKKVNLQLSGHTHKGQLVPFNLITRLFFKYNSGLFKLDSDSWLYVSRGTGTWGVPIRFLSFPEVTIIELVPISNK